MNGMPPAESSLPISLLAALCVLLGAGPAGADPVRPGQPAPAFSVRSDQEILFSRELAGRVIILTYEDRSVVEVNRPFKAAVLERWPQSRGTGPAIVPVIDCFSFLGPVRALCRNRVAAAAKKENLVLYTDCDGAMFRDYGLRADQSTIVIVDKKGVVRFSHTGRLEGEGILEALGLIDALVKQ